MVRWFSLLVAVAALMALSCGGDGNDDTANAIADRVLRLGEDVGTEVEIFSGELPPKLDTLLNPDSSGDEKTELPPLPDSKLVGSARVSRPDGLHTYFVMYEVTRDETAVAEAARGLFDETPWQIVGGQSSEGVTGYRFQSTRSSDLVGTVVVQPLASSDKFEVVVSRSGKEKKLTVQRHAFTPVLGAELDEREGGVVVERIGAGAGLDAGLQEGDRVIRIGEQEVDNLGDVSSALRALGEGKDPVTSVIYIVQISPENPIQSPFVLPAPRPVPRSFNSIAPYLLLDGSFPVAVEWSVTPQGSVYQFLLVSTDTLTDVAEAYRSALRAQNMTIVTDEAQGTSTTLEFTTPDSSLIGTVSIDTFSLDDNYTEASIQVQVEPGFSNTARPAGTPAPRPPTPTASPAATPTATRTP